ncbi:hypothetical protein MANES_10G083422v8 [Manihot esculenta]|uniref:Uncharacterized protein n=1 Tax=Manihot esculenta TaxID=3983 RepID=A0ACB7H0B3_MANES|nr:hypothetical protein MANES_10G083422v8 [Manihot esculenta]
MGESVQEQLNKLYNLLLAKQQANQSKNEKIKQLHTKLDATSLDLELTKKGMSSSSAESQTKIRKDKEISSTTVSENPGGNSIVSKFTKLDFPLFNGLEDPLGWLSCCQHFFCHQSTLEKEKVSLASYHLEGIAQLWYTQILLDVPDPT